MAEIRKQVLGKISGALGDVVFRERNGKSYVGVRPASFIPGTDPASVSRRLKFLTAIKFSQAINSEPVLKALWNKVKPAEISAFNTITRANYPFVEGENINDLAKIVPGLGFGVTANASGLDPSLLTLDIDAIGLKTEIEPEDEINIQLVSVLFFSNPLDDSAGNYYLTTISSASQHLDLENPLNFNASLLSEQTVYYNKFQDHKAFAVLVTLDSIGNPVHYSSATIIS
jgi:hypothetical protein